MNKKTVENIMSKLKVKYPPVRVGVFSMNPDTKKSVPDREFFQFQIPVGDLEKFLLEEIK